MVSEEIDQFGVDDRTVRVQKLTAESLVCGTGQNAESATVHRADGMIAATYALLGGIAYQVPDEAVKDKIMTVSVLPRATHQGPWLSSWSSSHQS